MPLTVVTKTADILGNPEEPNVISNNDSQLLYGEQFMVEEERGAYVYGHSVLDGYKGYVERDQLVNDAPAANSIVSVRASHLYLEPSFKSRPTTRLSFLSHIRATKRAENGFTQLENDMWIFSDHIAPLESFKLDQDLADIAEIFIGAPYLYAGRSTFGVDCSGLVQQSMMALGYDCPPRDSKDQQSVIGKPIKETDIKRNDIVFFEGHVGIMVDDKNIINATARHMSTVIEPLDDLKSSYKDGITHISRL